MRYRGFVVAIVLMLTSAAPALAEDPRWSISGSVNYSVGDYGTGTDTTLLYIPFTLGVTPIDRFTLSLTLPYIWQDTRPSPSPGAGWRCGSRS